MTVHPPVLFQSIEIFVGGRGGRERGHVPGRGWRTRQHRAFVAVNAELQEGERLMAFLDDVHVSTLPDRIADAHAAAGKHMHSKAGIVCTTGRPGSGIPKVRNQNVLMFWQRMRVSCNRQSRAACVETGVESLEGAGGPYQLHLGAIGAKGRRAQGVPEENTSHPRCAVSLVAFVLLSCSESQLLVEDGPTRIYGFFCQTPRLGPRRSMERGPLSSPVHHCRCPWVEWDWGPLAESAKPPTGRVGQTAWRW